jgi:hypothetical protein
VENLQRAIDWLRDAADEEDEGDAIGSALALVLQRWLEGGRTSISASEFNIELASALSAESTPPPKKDEARDV